MSNEIFSNRIETADPSNFSPREEMLDLEFLRKECRLPWCLEIFRDKNTGETFVKIKKERITRQKLATLILKGVINVSDVVEFNGEYYSHQQNLKNIESSSKRTKDEARADIIIMNLILNDTDHYFLDNDTETNSITEHKNILFDPINKKVNYFDFHLAIPDLLIKYKEDDVEIEKYFQGRLRIILDSFNFPGSEVIKIIKEKISLLYKNIESPSVFREMVIKSHIILTEQEQETLYYNITNRLKIFQKMLEGIE